MFHLLVTAGYDFNALRYEYTIAQVWRFYEAEQKRRMGAKRDLAVLVCQGVSAGTSADSQEGARQKTKQWTEFMDSLDWEALEKKATTKPNPMKAFEGLATIFKKGG